MSGSIQADEERDALLQGSVALVAANCALSFCASSAFCFWRSAGAACARAVRERRMNAVSFMVENMMDDDE